MFIPTARLLSRSAPLNFILSARFCSQNARSNNQAVAPKKKSYYMPEKQIRTDIYKPPHPLKFKNGRYLVYLNKQNLFTPFLLDMHYMIPLAYMAYLIAKNPFYLTFPAALPMLMIAEGVLLLRWFARKKHFKRQIERVYLLATGLQLQIVYSNKIRRYVKNNQMNTFHFIENFKSNSSKEQMEGIVEPTRGMKFPPDPYIKRQDTIQPLPTQYGWTFRDTEFNSYLLPAKYEFADWTILTKVLNGVNIDVTDCVEEGTFKMDELADVDEEIKNLQEQFSSKKGPEAKN